MKHALQQLSHNAAIGPDGVHPDCLKRAGSDLEEMLALLFNKSMMTGEVPQSFKEGYVIPLWKGGSREVCAN